MHARRSTPRRPNLDEMIQLMRDAFPDSLVARIDSAAPSNLARPGVCRVNVGVDRETFERLVGHMTDAVSRTTLRRLPS